MITSIQRYIEDNYGSRRGFIKNQWYRLLGLFGLYNQYTKIDWSQVDRLVFVCKGNICRSAYAEAVAKSLGLDAVSCGIDTIEAYPANEGAIAAARRSGLNLADHQTTPVMYLVLRKTDLLIAMEPWHCRFLKNNLFRGHQLTLLGLWRTPSLPHLQDPYGTSDQYFDICFQRINGAVKEIATKISG